MTTRVLSVVLVLYMAVTFSFSGTVPNNMEAASRAAVNPEARAITLAASPRLDITRDEYEEALARWRSHHALEYEITVLWSALDRLDGRWTLVVRQGQVKRSRCVCVYVSTENPTTYNNAVSFLTVEGQFAAIERVLNNPPPEDARISASFHPFLGYPTSIFYGSAREPYVGESARIETLSLRILERDTPGMPRTGNPGP